MGDAKAEGVKENKFDTAHVFYCVKIHNSLKKALFVYGIKNPNFMAYQFRSLSYKFAEEGKIFEIKRGNINYWRSLNVFQSCAFTCVKMANQGMKNDVTSISFPFSLLSQIHTAKLFSFSR